MAPRTPNEIDADARVLTEEIEKNFVIGMLRSVIETSHVIDKITSWILAGIGGASILALTNVDKLANYFELKQIGFVVILIVLAILLGLWEKYVANELFLYTEILKLLQQYAVPVSQQFKQQSDQLIAEANQIGHQVPAELAPNAERMISRFVEVLPFFIKRSVEKKLRLGLGDPFYSYRRAVRLFIRQRGLEFCLIGTTIATLFVIGYSLYV